MCCVNADTLRAHITLYSDSNTSPQRAAAVDFNALGFVPLARIVCEIFRIYARSSGPAIAVIRNYNVVYIMPLEPYEYHYLETAAARLYFIVEHTYISVILHIIT